MKWVLLILVLDNGNVWEKYYPTEAACEKEEVYYGDKLEEKGVNFISYCQKLGD